MKALAKAISSGSLRGARGNSGVILSQLLRGFTKEIQEAEQIDTFRFIPGYGTWNRNRLQGCYEAQGRNHSDSCKRHV